MAYPGFLWAALKRYPLLVKTCPTLDVCIV